LVNRITKNHNTFIACALAITFSVAFCTEVLATDKLKMKSEDSSKIVKTHENSATGSEQKQKETGFEVIFILMEKKQATVGDLLDTLLIYKGISPGSMTYEEKAEKLRQMGIIPARTAIDPKNHLHKGFAALLYYRAINVKGGLWLRLSGTGSRNCLRELVFQNIMPDSSEWDMMTGPELMALMGKAKAYEKKRSGIIEPEYSLETKEEQAASGTPQKKDAPAKKPEPAKDAQDKSATKNNDNKSEKRSSNLFNKNSEGR